MSCKWGQRRRNQNLEFPLSEQVRACHKRSILAANQIFIQTQEFVCNSRYAMRTKIHGTHQNSCGEGDVVSEQRPSHDDIAAGELLHAGLVERIGFVGLFDHSKQCSCEPCTKAKATWSTLMLLEVCELQDDRIARKTRESVGGQIVAVPTIPNE
jgi:hypothetical protein